MVEKKPKKTAVKIHPDSWTWIKNLQHTRWLDSGMKSQVTQEEIIKELISEFDKRKATPQNQVVLKPLDFVSEALQNLSTGDRSYVAMAIKILTSGPDLFVQALKANLMAFSGEGYAGTKDKPIDQGEEADREGMRPGERIEEVGGVKRPDRSDDAPLPQKKRARTKQHSPVS